MIKTIIDLFKGKFIIVRRADFHRYKKQSDKMNYVACQHYWFSQFPELKPIWSFVFSSDRCVEQLRRDYISLRTQVNKGDKK